jgi:hypothetical protein
MRLPPLWLDHVRLCRQHRSRETAEAGQVRQLLEGQTVHLHRRQQLQVARRCHGVWHIELPAGCAQRGCARRRGWTCFHTSCCIVCWSHGL